MANVTPGYVFTGTSDPITFAKLNLLGQPTVVIGAGEITNTMIAGTTITVSKLAALATSGSYIGSTPSSTTAATIQINNSGANLFNNKGITISDTAADSYVSVGQDPSNGKAAWIRWAYNATVNSAFAEFKCSNEIQLNANSAGTSAKYLKLMNGGSVIAFADPETNFVVGTGAIATTATAGFLYLVSCAGLPTGVPVDSYAGRYPMVYDSTNKKICIYDGGWIKTAALT